MRIHHYIISGRRQYSRAYYRATYISTAFDAGFVTAMAIRPKWMRDICSVALSGYYLIYAQEADEKVRHHCNSEVEGDHKSLHLRTR
jgi:hypothetical protein